MTKIRIVTENVQKQIIEGIRSASSIYILTSFVMKSGVDLLKPYLQEAAERGADIKICTGDYLYISQPQALENLVFSGYDNVEVRLWRSNGVSFHPKAYLFSTEADGTCIVGSSNLSKSALTTGIEWNLVMEKEAQPETFEEALDEFLKIFYNNQTVPVNEETVKKYSGQYENYHQRHPRLATSWAKQEEIALMLPDKEEGVVQLAEPPGSYQGKIEPRPAQRQALDALHGAMEEEYDKAMVVMATGLGKTYLAAFFAERFNRVLFVAHREEILHQAKKSFQQVMPGKEYGMYNGKMKETGEDGIFASIYTLSMKEHLLNFPPDYFDLVVIDEFHHAAAKSYKQLLEYFEPEFLLGITATPDRMDGKDVFALCDGNVAYQLHFIEAIQEGWLAPFHYYGVYDETDYSQVTWLGTQYDQTELLAVQLREEIAANILQAWQEHKQTRTIGFCSSVKQAEFLSAYFNKSGYHTVALHSKAVDVNRRESIQQLERGELDVIFTVDLFNEGVDIPPVDTLLFVRPTESLTVFTQQVGRGLRLYGEKDQCNIIDLIGNYRNADIKLSLFDTERENKGGKSKNHLPIVPGNCAIDLETEVINLFNELNLKKQPRKEKLLHAYQQLKEELGRRPSYLEAHLYGNVNAREYKQEFKSYAGFLSWTEELTDKEQHAFLDYKNWLEEVERTGMTKSYKMIVLSYMLSRGEQDWHKPVTPEEAAPYFHHFLTEKEHRRQIDFSDKKTKLLWEYDHEKIARLIADMPMTKWSGNSKGLTEFEDGEFRLGFDVGEMASSVLFELTKEICEYRLHAYFERKAEKI